MLDRYGTAGGARAVGGQGRTRRWPARARRALGRGLRGSVRALRRALLGGVLLGLATGFAIGPLPSVAHAQSAWAPLGGVGPASTNALVTVGSTLYDGTSSQGVMAWNGSAWSEVGALPSGAADVLALAVSSDGTTLYAGTQSDGVWSLDLTSATPTWTLVSSANSGESLAVIGNELYASVSNSGQVQVYAWNGTQWSALGSQNDPMYANSVNSIADLNGELVAGTGAGVWEWDATAGAWTELGGASGTVAQMTIESMTVSGTDLFVTGGGGVWEWNGTAWSQVGSATAGPNEDTGFSVLSIGSLLYVGTAHSGLWQWNGSAWSEVGALPSYGQGPSTYASTMAASGGGTDLYVAYGYGSTVWEWNGSTWSPVGPPTGLAAESILASGSDLYVGGFESGVWSWNGSAWQNLPAIPGGATVTALGGSGTSLLAGTGAGQVYTGNATSGWTPLSGLGNAQLCVSTNAGMTNVLPVTGVVSFGGNVYAATEGNGVFVDLPSPDTSFVHGCGLIAGVGSVGNWAPSVGGPGTANALLATGTTLYAGGQSGVFSLASGATTWSSLPLPSGVTANQFDVTSLAADGGTLYAGTYADGVWAWNGSSWTEEGSLGGNVTAVSTLDGALYAVTVGASPGVWTWTGSTWQAVGSLSPAPYGSSNSVTTPVLVATGGALYVGSASGVLSMAVGSGAPAAPSLASLSPTGAALGAALTLTGSGLGTTPGTVVFQQGTAAPVDVSGTLSGWSDTSVTVTVPSTLTPGEDASVMVVTSAGATTNTLSLAILSPPGWSELTGLTGAATAVSELAASTTTLYAATAAGVWLWDGSTWTSLGPIPGTGTLSAMTDDAGVLDAATLYGGGTGSQVWTYSGDSWTQVGDLGSQLPATATIDALLAANGTLYAATTDGVWTSSGGAWSEAGTVPSGSSVVTSLAASGGTVYAGTTDQVFALGGAGGVSQVGALTATNAMGEAASHVLSLAVVNGALTAGTSDGTWTWSGGSWSQGPLNICSVFTNPCEAVTAIVPWSQGVAVDVQNSGFWEWDGSAWSELHVGPADLPTTTANGPEVGALAATGSGGLYAYVENMPSTYQTADGVWQWGTSAPPGGSTGTSSALSIVTSASLPTAAVGVPYALSLGAAGGTPPYTWSLAGGSSLPAGLTLAADGLLSGTPTATGTATFTAAVTDSASPADTATAELSLTVASAPSVPLPDVPAPSVSTAPGLTLVATPAVVPTGAATLLTAVDIGANGPVAGESVTFSTSGGTLSSTTATTDGEGLVRVFLSDSQAETDSVTATAGSQGAQASVTFKAFALPSSPLAGHFAATTLPDVASAVSLGASADGTDVVIAPPKGAPSFLSALSLTLGDLAGLPPETAASAVQAAVEATSTAESLLATSSEVTLGSAAGASAPPVAATFIGPVVTFSTENATLGASAVFNDQGTQTNDALQVTLPFNISALPAGSTPAVVWLDTASSPATWTNAGVVILSVNTGAGTVTALLPHLSTYTVVASQPVAVTTTALASATVGASYSASLAAEGGTTPYSWSLAGGNLPPGLSLTAAGVVTGTPTAGGTYGFTVSVSDSATPPASATATLSLLVAAVGLGSTPTPTPTPSSSAQALTSAYTTVGAAAAATLTTGDGAASLTVPKGAFASPTEVTVDQLTPTQLPTALPASIALGGTAVELTLGTAGSIAAVPLALTLNESPASLPAPADAYDLEVFQLVGTGAHAAWLGVPTTADMKAQTVTAAVVTGGVYAVGVVARAATIALPAGAAGLTLAAGGKGTVALTLTNVSGASETLSVLAAGLRTATGPAYGAVRFSLARAGAVTLLPGASTTLTLRYGAGSKATAGVYTVYLQAAVRGKAAGGLRSLSRTAVAVTVRPSP